jgi:hypothetical protein
MSTTEMPHGDTGPRYLRLQAELVLEVTSPGELRTSALARIADDTFMPQQERTHAVTAVGEDESEALAYLVDPVDLVADLPGVELVQASWSCAHTEYDPASDDWMRAEPYEGDEDEDMRRAADPADSGGATLGADVVEGEDDLR